MAELDGYSGPFNPFATDSTMGYFPAKYDIKSPNHAVMSIGKGKLPDCLENAALQRTPPMYHRGGAPILEKYLVHPKIKVTPLRVLARRESLQQITSQAERVPKSGMRVRHPLRPGLSRTSCDAM